MAKPTQTDRVYGKLRADVLAGRLQPGEKLAFAQTCARYATSAGVLREVLTRLAGQGLVVNEPQLGFRVTPLSARDLSELTEARLFVEGEVIRLAVAAGDVEWESSVVAAHHTLERTPQSVASDQHRLSDDWVRAHARFHESILMGCQNRRLLEIAENLRASAELYRRWSVSLGGHDERDIPGEHRRILQAVLDRDADVAVAALSEHISATSRRLEHAGGAVDEIVTSA